MVSFLVKINDELVYRLAQRRLSEENHLVQTFLAKASPESFHASVEIG
jgi:hypothetical protein